MARAGAWRGGVVVVAGLALALSACAGAPTAERAAETRSGGSGSGGSGSGGGKPSAKPATPRPTATPAAQGTLVAEEPRRAMSLVKNKGADGSLVEVLFDPEPPAAEWTLTANGVVLLEALDVAYRVVEGEAGAREVATASSKPLEVRWPARIPDSQPMTVRWTVDQGRIYALAKEHPTATGFEVVLRPKGPGGAAVALADGAPFELAIAIKAL